MNKILIIFAIAFFSVLTNEAHASCIADVDYGLVHQESELVFKGTVTSIDNSMGPQLVYFVVHEVAKGTITNDRYVLKNLEMVNHGNGSYTLSSNDVDYKIGTTYNVYVTNGQTSLCTTKITAPPTSYILDETLPLVPPVYKSTGSYELDEVLCFGGRGMVMDENCQRIWPSPYSQQQQDGIEPEQVKCNMDLYRSYKTSDGSAFCASGFALRELIHRGYAESFDAISSWTIDRPNSKATEYCPAGQELAQWGWYGEKNPDVRDTNIDLNYDPDENSHGVEFTFDPINNPETDGKSMIWVFVECSSGLED